MKFRHLIAAVVLSGVGSPVAAAEPSPRLLAAKTDADGDPLPEGAVLRLGSKRWRIAAKPQQFALSEDGSVLRIGTDSLCVERLDLKTGRRLAALGTPTFMWGFDDRVGMAFSADGKRFAIVDRADSKLCVTIRDKEGKGDLVCVPFRETPKHQAPKLFSGSSSTFQVVTALAFSPNGKVLAGADWYRFEVDGATKKEKIHEEKEECAIRLWDAATGKDLASCTGHTKQVHTLSFSADGKILTSASEDGTIRFWNAETGKEQGKPWQASSPIHAAALSPDRKQIAVGTAKGLQIWDAAASKVKHHMEIPGGVRAAAYSPDGKTLVSGGTSLRFWTAATGKPIAELKASQPVRALAFAVDGLTLFSGHEGEQKIRRWDVATRRSVAEPEGQSGFLRLLAFSRDGKHLITFAIGDNFRVWDLASGKLAPTPKEDDSELSLGLLASTGRSAPLVGIDGFAASLSRMAGEVSRIDQIPGLLGCSTDGRRVLIATDKDKKTIFEVRDDAASKVLRQIAKKGKEELSAALAPDGKTVAVADKEGLSFMDVDTGKERRYPIAAKKRDVFSGCDLKFSLDSSRLALVGSRGTARVGAWVSGSRLALVGSGGTVKILAVKDGRLLKEIKTGEYEARGLAFSPDGQTLLTTASLRNVALWEIATGQLIRTEAVETYQFSPDNRFLVSSNGDSNIAFLDLYSGKTVRECKSGAAAASNFTFAPDGKHLAAGYNDCTVVIWDTPSPSADTAFKGKRLGELWADLEAGPAQPAYAAIGVFAADPIRALPFLNERMKPAERLDKKNLSRWTDDLGHDDFSRREQAERELYLVGTEAEEMLLAALKKAPALEAKVRIERLLKKIDRERMLPAPAERAQVRAVQAVERVGTAEARTLLRRLSEGDAAAPRTIAAQDALRRLNP